MSETKEWKNGEPNSEEYGTYLVETSSGLLMTMAKVRVRGRVESHFPDVHFRTDNPIPIARYYGPLTIDELLAGIPKPPPRLPKAHPDKYLAHIVVDADGLKYAFIGHDQYASKSDPRCAVALIGGAECWTKQTCYVSTPNPTRYAQQDKDGIWREVDASDLLKERGEVSE